MMENLDDNDESMLRNPRHHRHSDGSREATMAAAIVFFGSLVGLTFVGESGLPRVLVIFGLLCLSILAFWGVQRLIGGAEERRNARLDAEYRAAREAETERRLAEMRAREAGDG